MSDPASVFLAFFQQRLNCFLEYPAPVFVVIEHVKAGTSRGQQHDVAGTCDTEPLLYCLAHRICPRDFECVPDGRSYLVGGGADEKDVLHPTAHRMNQGRIRCTLILSAENEDNISIKGFHRLDGGID